MSRRLPMWLVIASLALSVPAAGALGEPRLEMQKIVVSQSGAGDPTLYTPYYVAQAKGFFREQGLEVSADGVAGVQELVQMANGQAQFASYTTFAVLSAAKGRPLITVAELVDQYGMDVVLSNAALAKKHVSRSDPIAKRIEALRGMRIGITSVGSGADTFARYVFPKYGLDPDKDVVLVTLGSCAAEMAALQSGNIDAFLCGLPAPAEAEVRGFGKIIVSGGAGDVPELRGIVYSGYFARPDFIAQNPNTVQAFVNAITKAIRFIHQHPADAENIVAQQNASFDPAIYKATFDAFLKTVTKTTVVRADGMARMIDVIKTTTPSAAGLDAYKLIDNTFAERAMKTVGR